MILIHSEVCTVMDYELVHFIERTLIEQHVDTFAGCHVTVGVLSFHAFYATTLRSKLIQLLKFLYIVLLLSLFVFFNYIQSHYHLIAVDRISFVYQDFLHYAFAVYLVVALHLHSFKDNDGLPLFYGITHIYLDIKDYPPATEI